MAVTSETHPSVETPRQSDGLAELMELSNDQPGAADIAGLNLMAARFLPGAENLNVEECLRVSDRWAKLVRLNTEHWWPEFERSPREFGGSPAQFRIMAMVTVLQRDLGVHYNLAYSEGEYSATDSRNQFLHGLLGGHGGTCVSMPVLYAAIGRRLGYPLKLAEAKKHVFARWDDPQGERFNIESTSQGFMPRDDDYYRRWPGPISEDEVRRGLFLRSLEPREELALFLRERGCCLCDNLRFADALETYYHARQLAPKLPGISGNWAIATMLYQSVRPTPSGFQVRWPRATEHWHRSAIPEAKKCLHRIFKIHGIREAKAQTPKRNLNEQTHKRQSNV